MKCISSKHFFSGLGGPYTDSKTRSQVSNLDVVLVMCSSGNVSAEWEMIVIGCRCRLTFGSCCELLLAVSCWEKKQKTEKKARYTRVYFWMCPWNVNIDLYRVVKDKQ